jgi:tetratricopeptide (TPR) repeat protein
LTGVWDDGTHLELEQHFATLEADHVPDSSQRVIEGLDRWAGAWVAEREQVCHSLDSTKNDRTELIARDECLDRQREHVGLIVGMLVKANGDELAHAVLMVDELPMPASCIDEPLAQLEPPPPAVAARVAEIRQEVARARELRRLGRLEQGHDAARAANEAALAIDFGPLQAEARAELAMAEDLTGSPSRSAKLYEEAIDLAEIHRHDQLIARLWVERAELSLFHLDDVEQGKGELHRAEVAHARIASTLTQDADAWASARLAFAHGWLAELDENLSEARERYRNAVILARAAAGADLPDYLNALARVTDTKDQALALRHEAVEFAQLHWGPRHPRTAKPTFELGLALLEAGRGGDRELEAAAAIWTDVHQRPHSNLAKAHMVRGREALERGELDVAEAHARSMATIQARVLLGLDPARGEPEQLLATIESIRGNHESALAHARVALAWFELEESDDPVAWSMRQLIVDELLALDRLDEAEQELQSMLAAASPDTNRLKSVHLQLAELAVRRNLLENADLQLRTVAELDGDEHSFVYEFLRALVDLRLGRLELAQVERVQSVPQPFSSDQLSEWFDQLALTPGERHRLAQPD